MKKATADRSPYIRCVRRILKAEAHTTFCGREIAPDEQYFFSPDHAVQSGLMGTEFEGHRLEACSACRKVIAQALAGKPETKAKAAAATVPLKASA